MGSAKKPLWLVWNNPDPLADKLEGLFLLPPGPPAPPPATSPPAPPPATSPPVTPTGLPPAMPPPSPLPATNSSPPQGHERSAISFKNGDDFRQDMLTLQVTDPQLLEHYQEQQEEYLEEEQEEQLGEDQEEQEKDLLEEKKQA